MDNKDISRGGCNGPETRFANYFESGQNAFEFVLQFGHLYGEDESIVKHTRIVTTPSYAKALFDVLRRSIEQHEEAFGPIKESASEEDET